MYKPPFPLLACLLACLHIQAASAQVYQWKDSNGRTVISDTPPPGGAKESRKIGGSLQPNRGTPAPAADDAAQKSMAEKEMDFRKRQQESREKAEKADKEQQAAAERKRSCEQAQRQLTTLESGMRVATTDEKGERRYLEDAERQQEIERARRLVSENCK